MASTPDMAPNRTAPSATPAPRRRRSSSAAASARAASRSREDELGDQVEQLQADLKSIAATLAGLAEDKVGEAKSMAKQEVRNLKRAGQHAVEEAQDEFTQIERQLKDTIREKPLTAVAGAVALGFILAVLTR